jgi:hypothetical protein
MRPTIAAMAYSRVIATHVLGLISYPARSSALTTASACLICLIGSRASTLRPLSLACSARALAITARMAACWGPMTNGLLTTAARTPCARPRRRGSLNAPTLVGRHVPLGPAPVGLFIAGSLTLVDHHRQAGRSGALRRTGRVDPRQACGSPFMLPSAAAAP